MTNKRTSNCNCNCDYNYNSGSGFDGGGEVAFGGQVLAHFCVHLGVFWLPGGEAVDVAVAQSAGGGDEDGGVDCEVGCALFAGLCDIFWGDVFAALLDFAGDGEEGFQFV